MSASSLSLLGLIVLIVAVTAIESRAVPDADKLMPWMLDPIRNPLMIFRDKRGSIQGHHPSRTMMFTGFYRPPRRSGSNSQATSIYTEGNAIGGGAYFSQPVYLGEGPDPTEEGDGSSSIAEAHSVVEDEEDQKIAVTTQDSEIEEDKKQATTKPPKAQKKGKNIPIDKDDEDDEDEDDDEDDEEYRRSTKSRGRKYRPANNYFPMLFSFPGSTSRRGSSSELGSGGPITAVANSYSTSKGGVASSVATAFGGSPIRKPRRRHSS